MTTNSSTRRHFVLATAVSLMLSAALLPPACVLAQQSSSSTDKGAAVGGSPATSADSGQSSTAASTAKTAPVGGASGSTAGNADNKSPANTAVPDWLKVYDKPGMVPTTPGPESAGTSVEIQRHTGAGSGSSTMKTSLGPLNPPGSAIPSRVVPTINSAATAPKAIPKMLQGRLEQVGGSGARLPVGLSLKGLKAQAGKLDKSVFPAGAQNTQIAGAISSFPMDWQGSWGGPLKIHDSQLDPIEWQFDATEAKGFQEILVRGTTVQGSFSFTQAGTKVQAEPGVLVFPARKTSAAEMDQALASSGMGALFSGANGSMMRSMLSGMNLSQPRMYLGDLGKTRGVGGNEVSSRVMRNLVRQLKEGVIEEDIISREQDKSVNTGKSIQKISETVIRFTRLNQSQLYVQGAAITYRDDGHFLNKILFYGTINRGAGGAADPMMGLPGLGGLGGGAGGMGGMDAINQMMKQLQGN
jgi:hypothetical protein